MTAAREVMGSAYMNWAKTCSVAKYNLATSGLGNVKLTLAPDPSSKLTLIANSVALPLAQDPLGLTREHFESAPRSVEQVALDFDTRKEVARIKYPDVDKKTPGHGGNTSHGIAVTPDQKTLVANSSINSVVYIYSLPDLKLTGQIPVGHSPNWITLTPDGKYAYVSLAGANSVSVIDIKAAKQVTEIKTGGQVPKRNATIVMSQ